MTIPLDDVEDPLISAERKRVILEAELSLLRKCTREYIARAAMKEYPHLRIYSWIRDSFVCLGSVCAALFVVIINIQLVGALLSKIPPEPRTQALILLAILVIASAAVAWLLNKEIRMFISEAETECNKARKIGEARKAALKQSLSME